MYNKPGQIGAGLNTVPAFRDLVASYLSDQATINNSAWYPAVPDLLAYQSANAAPLLAPYSALPTDPWSADVLGVAGLTMLLGVRAINLVGDGTLNAGNSVVDDLGAGSGRLKAPIYYLTGDVPPSIVVDGDVVPEPFFPWDPLSIRTDIDNWAAPGSGDQLWCVLPGCVYVGMWGSADTVTAPYVPQIIAQSYAVVLPALFVLASYFPSTKYGIPGTIAPLTWTTWLTGDGPAPLPEIWSEMRSAVPGIEALEQGTQMFFSGVQGSTWCPLGWTGNTRPQLL